MLSTIGELVVWPSDDKLVGGIGPTAIGVSVAGIEVTRLNVAMPTTIPTTVGIIANKPRSISNSRLRRLVESSVICCESSLFCNLEFDHFGVLRSVSVPVALQSFRLVFSAIWLAMDWWPA